MSSKAGSALAQVAHYIHLNPVRAKVVTVERVLTYRWSSLPQFIGRKRPAWLAAETILAESGNLRDTPAGWRCYLAYLGVLAEEEAKLRAEKFSRLSRGWVVGSSDFKAGVKKQLADQGDVRERFEVLGADRDEKLEDAIKYKFTIKPTYVSRYPTWSGGGAASGAGSGGEACTGGEGGAT